VGIRSILLKNWEGIRVLGKVFAHLFDFLKMFEYFFEYTYTFEYFESFVTLGYFDFLGYFGILWNDFEILCKIPMKKMHYQRVFTSGSP